MSIVISIIFPKHNSLNIIVSENLVIIIEYQQQQQHTSMVGQTQPVAIKQNPNLPVIDCKLSSWSPWSTCSALCGNGKRTRSRYIIQMPQNGGKPCDKKLSRTQRCKDLPPCPQEYHAHSGNQLGSQKSPGRWTSGNLSGHRQTINNRHHKQGGGHEWRTNAPVTITTTSTTPGSSMMDDEDDSKFSRLLQSGIMPPANFNSTMSILMDEMELIGSTNFHVKDGHIYHAPESPTSSLMFDTENALNAQALRA